MTDEYRPFPDMAENPELAEMHGNLDDEFRTQIDAVRDAVNRTTELVNGGDLRLFYLIEEIVCRTLGRPPVFDEAGEDEEYWSTRGIVTMMVLNRCASNQYWPAPYRGITEWTHITFGPPTSPDREEEE